MTNAVEELRAPVVFDDDDRPYLSERQDRPGLPVVLAPLPTPAPAAAGGSAVNATAPSAEFCGASLSGGEFCRKHPGHTTRHSKRPPTSRRRKDNDEYRTFAHRMLRAYARRAAEADPTVLPDILALHGAVDEAARAAVEVLRRPTPAGQPGYSWAEIGRAVGTSRQAALRRFSR